MDFLVLLIVVFIVICICTCCGLCCKRKREGAIFSTPVVVTSQTHTNAGPYPVTVQGAPAVVPPIPGGPLLNTGAYPMPQPHYTGVVSPYAQNISQPQPTNFAPYPSNTPYPMPMPQATMNPPSYTEVMGNEAYQKQAPYNPNYGA